MLCIELPGAPEVVLEHGISAILTAKFVKEEQRCRKASLGNQLPEADLNSSNGWVWKHSKAWLRLLEVPAFNLIPSKA